MKILNSYSKLQSACRDQQSFGLYLSFNPGLPLEEIQGAAPCLNHVLPILLDGDMILLFDSKLEMEEAYKGIVGDDGPTPSNPYKGPAKVFACRCDPNGNLLGENT